jgi:hypothetical protein
VRIETLESGFHRVYLSRRNLLSLLAKLDGHPPDSVCTIVGPEDDFAVTAEEDIAHYTNPARGAAVGIAGAMHPDTEETLA